MQPYFLPYIGYFQLISAVDLFIVYDNIKYTKKGWINRNRFLLNGGDAIFSLPLQNNSDSLDICNRKLSSEFDAIKILNKFRGAYHRAPYFNSTFLLLEKIIENKEVNLFNYIYFSIKQICDKLGVHTNILKSSDINIDHSTKSQEKVLSLCKAVGATTYVNTIGGVDLYEKEIFSERGVELRFMRSLPIEYPQLGNTFVPWLSIIDVMMFNDLDKIASVIKDGYEFI